MTGDIAGRFDGSTVVVTGASAGIGRATALRLVREGARVVAADVSEAGLESLAAEAGSAIVPVAGDLTLPGAVEAAVAAGEGEIDGVAHVVGITDGWLPPEEIDDSTWHRVLDLNITLPMRLTRAVLPQMLERGRGSHVYVSSEAGLRASLGGAAYTTSKHGLNGFAKSVAYYYGRVGIRANAIAPGGVRTEMDSTYRSEFARSVTTPALRPELRPQSVEPEVVAHSILWLLSDDSPNINGAVLPTDGGWSVM